MQTRTTSKQVTFTKPFRLEDFDDVQPPGTYTLSLEEEQLDTHSFVGWRQTAATLLLTRGSATDYVAIDMRELQDALVRDSGQPTDPPAASAAARRLRGREFLRLRGRQA
jgi:hypothetical protein